MLQHLDVNCKAPSCQVMAGGRLQSLPQRLATENLSQGIGEGRINIRWKGHRSWTAKVNTYKLLPSNSLTNCKCVQISEQEGSENWLYKVHVYFLCESPSAVFWRMWSEKLLTMGNSMQKWKGGSYHVISPQQCPQASCLAVLCKLYRSLLKQPCSLALNNNVIINSI